MRRFRSLIRNLPRESATVQAAVGEPAQWDVTDHMLAAVIDSINELIYVTISAHSKQRPQRPKPVPRPQQPEPSRPATTDEIAQFFGSNGASIGGR